ncbi:MAG: S8 family serine peptidase [Thermoleophilia bacterium]
MRTRSLLVVVILVLALLALAVAGIFIVFNGRGNEVGSSTMVSTEAAAERGPAAGVSDADINESPAEPENGQSQSHDIADASTGGKTNPKVQSSINELAAVQEALGAAAAAEFASRHDLEIKDGGVTIVVEAAPGSDATAAVTAAGGRIQTSHGDLIQASVPVEGLAGLSADSTVKYIREPSRPTAFATIGEGSADIGATSWQASGYSGAGVKIAILDPGFASYQQAISSGDLPANVITRSFRSDADITGGGEVHGTACAEIVHDVAPGAQLYLVNFSTDVELGNAVDYLATQGVTVVSASWGFFGSFRGDGQGQVDDMVLQARNAGIFWSNAAGNAAQSHWSGPFTDSDNDTWNEFSGADEHNTVSAQSGEQLDIYLAWNRWPATDQDYDMYLVWEGQPNTTVAASDSWQSGTQPPVEEIHYTVPSGRSGNYWIVIKNYSAAGDAVFQLYTYPKTVQHQVAAGSLGGQPADSADAMIVGAVPVNNSSIEAFSSRGPTIDGRVKPDIVAPDRVSTFTYGPAGFWGTSAAAPHVAGAGALVKGANFAYTPAQVQGFLESRVTDLGASGKDNVYGSGKLALGMAPDFAAPVITGVSPSGNIYSNSAVVSAYYADTGSGINTSSVQVTLDGAGLAGCAITGTYVSCPASNLQAGTHAIGGSVADNAGNSGTISGSFTIICGAPQITLGTPRSFWGSYPDYLARELSVSYAMCDTGGTGAYDIKVVGSINTGSVFPASVMPMSLGDIPGGTSGCLSLTIKYVVPSSVASFRSITFVTSKDACGTEYAIPGAYPGA